MADFEQPIVGDAGAFERGAKEILARAEAALRASVQTLGEVRSLAGQIRDAASASAGEEQAAAAINRKAEAAERAAAAVRQQNVELRAAGAEAGAQDRAAVAMERKAVAAERLASSTRAIRDAEARGQGALFDEAAGGQPRLAGSLAPGNQTQATLGFAMPTVAVPLADIYEREAVESRQASVAMREHVSALEAEAAQLRVTAGEVTAVHRAQLGLLDASRGAQDRLFAPGDREQPRREQLEGEALAERNAAAAMREHVAMLEAEAAQLRLRRATTYPTPGHGQLFDESRGAQPRLFAPDRGEPLTLGFEREAQDRAAGIRSAQENLARYSDEMRTARGAEERLVAMEREATAEQARLSAVQREAAANTSVLSRGIGGMARGYAEFLGVATGVGVGISAFHNIIEGAQQSQQGVQDLKRVLHEVDPDAATRGFRELSTQFNVPIQQVAESQFGFARVTQDQTQALEATRAALAATKLDAIGAGDSVKYLTVAMQAFHLTGEQVSAPGGVFDQLENVSRRLGVPVGQIMQSFRALPAVANTGGDLTQFIGISAAAVRAAGRSGTEINTAIARAATNFVPRNADVIKSFNLDPNESITQLLIDAAHRARSLNQAQRRDLANAIGGPLRGGSTILGLLNRPDVLDRALREADPNRARGATEDEMRAVMGRIDSQVQEVGKHLANFGAALSQSGVLNGLGVMAHLLTTVVDKATTLADIFHAIPGHNIIAPLAEGAGAVALARRFNVGQRFEGSPLLGFLAGPLSRPAAAGHEALAAERSAIGDELARTRSRAVSASMDMRIAASVGDEQAATAAQQRLNALREREAQLVQESAVLANRTAEEQLEVNAARERGVAAQGSGLILPAGVAGAAGAGAAVGARGAERAATRDALEAMGFGAVGSRMGSMFAQSEESVALESMGFGAAGRFGMRGLAGLNGLKGAGALAVYFAAFQQLQGTTETQGNAVERLEGGGRSVLGMFGIHTAPITNVENRKAGAKDAQEYIAGLRGGMDFQPHNEAVMNARREALTNRINALDEQDGGNKYRVAAEMRKLQAELAHETALEQAAAAMDRARRTGAAVGPQNFLGMNAKELEAAQATALAPMGDIGDDRGLAAGIGIAEAFATLGHRKKRADLLQKADQAIKANVQAITGELTDNLALASNASERAEAYDQALADANRLINSHSPAQHRAGELLARQVDIQRAQDDAQRRATATGTATAEHPGRTVGAAQRAADDARRNYLDLADKGLAHTQQGRDAYQKYLEAQNAIDDAVQQRIQLDTATAQAKQQTAAGKDRAAVTGLRRQLAAAQAATHPNANTIAELTNQLADAEAQLTQQDVQDANARVDAHYALLEAQTDDPLQQALDAYRDALNQTVDPTDPNGPAKKAALVAQAAQRYRQQQRQQAEDLIQGNQAMRDARIDPFDQVALDRSAERAAREHLANLSPGADLGQRRAAQAQVTAAHHKTARDRQQMAFEDIEFNAQIGKYTTDMEVAALRRLESTVKNNRGLKRQIQAQIYQLTHQNESQLELNLGNIRLPSPYEVNRAIREAGGGGRASARGMAVHNSVNVTVTGDTDIGKMAGAIDSVVGTSTRSALRAAGVL